MKNLSAFVNEYRAQLLKAVEERPQDYCYGAAGVPLVVDRMTVAFEHGTYNHDGLAIRRTCKALGIKTTRTAINAFLRGI